jgi:hypothetical protein
MADTLGKRLRAMGWQCGSLIPESLYPEIEALAASPIREPLRPQAADWLVVLSQSCDLLAESLDQEPHVELLWCRPIPRPRAQFRDMRSTRRLDFRPHRQNHADVVLSAHAAQDRYVVPRSLLAAAAPRGDRILSAVSVQRLQAWIALRYSRPAWPDQFVGRITPARERLLEALESVERDDIAEVRIALAPNDAELPDGENYRVVVFFVVDEEVWNTAPAERSRIYTAFGAFVSALGSCPGVQLDDASEVVNGARFTWQQTQMTELWNFANLTWRE